MPVVSEALVSKSEQRAIEKAKKDAAIAKKRSVLAKAMVNGLSSDTEIASKFIRNEWIGLAGLLIGNSAKHELLSGKGAESLPSNVKKDLIPFMTIADENGVYPISNQFAKIVLETMLDIVFITSGEHVADVDALEPQLMQKFYDAVADKIDVELRLLALADSHPNAYYSLISVLNNPAYSAAAKDVARESALNGYNAYEQASLFFEQGAAYEVPMPMADAPRSIAISREDAERIGAFLIKQVTSAVPEDSRFWQVKSVLIEKKTHDYLVLADHLDGDAILDEISQRAHYYRPVDQVASWQENEFGGYLMNSITHEQSFIRGHQHQSVASDLVRKCVDNVQDVRYYVNAFILGIANELSVEKFSFGKFVSPKGVHYTKSMRSRQSVAAANEWAGRSFVTPWNVDYRGRMYSIASVLTIQSTDFEKSLLKFAEAQPINSDTAYWLGVHLANTYGVGGVDKLPLDERVEWANSDDAQQLIMDVATKPVQMIRGWVAGDMPEPAEPWQFIAACEEFYALYLAPVAVRRNATDLPVAVDASCSGIQVLSGLIKDEVAGRLVNVTPSDVKQDAYQEVANIVKAKLQQPVTLNREEIQDNGKKKRVKHTVDLSAYADLVSRSVVKKLVMTLAYNASALSQGEYIVEALKPVKDQIAAEDRKFFYSAIGILGREAMEQLLPQVIGLKKWMAAAAESSSAQLRVLRYKTPSGMVLGQKKNVIETILIQSGFAGSKKKIELAVGIKDEVASGDHKTCTMPNVVHALDASLLHVAFAEFDKPFALIHDSVLATASDIAKAIEAYKASYVQHFASNDAYDELQAMFGGAQAPSVGNLQIESVAHSQFFLA